MLLRLAKPLSDSALETILGACREMGYEVTMLGSTRELMELRGEGRPDHRSRFEDLTGVAEVLDAADAPELHSRGSVPGGADSVVRAAGAAFGGGHVSLIAGPCAVEDTRRLVEVARAVRARGATLLRGGAFKPRTSPYSFPGLGRAGLEALARVKDEVGIGVVTEVLDPRDVEIVGAVADAFQIGSRSMQNGPLLREVGRAGKPVLLKRGFSSTLREFLLAAEFVLSEGNPDVILCERGIRGVDDFTRNVLDVGAVAALARETHLPVVVDPSHAAGHAALVRPLARAGLAAGADGLLVEVHPEPGELHSDGAQAVTLGEFAAIAGDAQALVELDGRKLVLPGSPRAEAPSPGKECKEPVA